MRSDGHARRFQPQIGHWTATVVVNQDRSLMAMWHVAGLDAELSGARAIVSDHMRDNQAVRNISDPRIEIWDHFVRQDRQSMAALPAIPNWFAARFDGAYRQAQGDEPLYRNDLFITVIMHCEESMSGGVPDHDHQQRQVQAEVRRAGDHQLAGQADAERQRRRPVPGRRTDPGRGRRDERAHRLRDAWLLGRRPRLQPV